MRAQLWSMPTACRDRPSGRTAPGHAPAAGAPSPFLGHLTDVSAQVGWGVILEALTAAVVVALLASAATTWMIGRIQPAEAVRSE